MSEQRSEYAIPKDLRQRKKWCCKRCGRVLGEVFKNNHIYHLAVTGNDIIATGNIQIRCECGHWQEWYMDKYALDLIIERSARLAIATNL